MFNQQTPHVVQISRQFSNQTSIYPRYLIIYRDFSKDKILQKITLVLYKQQVKNVAFTSLLKRSISKNLLVSGIQSLSTLFKALTNSQITLQKRFDQFWIAFTYKQEKCFIKFQQLRNSSNEDLHAILSWKHQQAKSEKKAKSIRSLSAKRSANKMNRSIEMKKETPTKIETDTSLQLKKEEPAEVEREAPVQTKREVSVQINKETLQEVKKNPTVQFKRQITGRRGSSYIPPRR